MNLEDPRTIGTRLRRIRLSRDKSLRTVAELTGICRTLLSEYERGERALDRISHLVALADVLQVAPTDLTQLPVPSPANGHTDTAIDRVRLALMASIHDLPDGHIQPIEDLQARVNTVITALCYGDHEREVGAALPRLIRDLATTQRVGKDGTEIRYLTALLHAQGTVPWLRLVGASLDLCTNALSIARNAAHDHQGPGPLGVVAAATARVMLFSGALDLAIAAIDATPISPATPELTELAGFLALRGAVVASAVHRHADAEAQISYAAELAERTGQGSAFFLGFGPTTVGTFRMQALSEAGHHKQALEIATSFDPAIHPWPSGRAFYWVNYGRAAARVKGMEAEAVLALRRAEQLSPHSVQRNMFARDTLTELVSRARRDAVGRELRGLAYRSGIAV